MRHPWVSLAVLGGFFGPITAIVFWRLSQTYTFRDWADAAMGASFMMLVLTLPAMTVLDVRWRKALPKYVRTSSPNTVSVVTLDLCGKEQEWCR